MKSDPPPAPDYVGAANAQGAANKEAAVASAKLSNPNITNPYGSQTVTYGAGGDPDIPTVTQTLSPAQQGLFDQNNRISAGLGNLAEGGIGRVGALLGTQFDMSQIPGQAQAGQQGWENAYNAITQRNQPFMDRQESMLKAQLANQGLAPDSEAYKNAMMDLGQQQNNFNLGAQAQATDQQQAQFGMDTQARQNAISQEAYLRQLPLNEINALRSGSQINVPQFQAYQGQSIAPAPVMQGVQNQYQADLNSYNAQQGGMNNMMSGLFGLGGAALMGPIGGVAAGGLSKMFSDIRLKENIRRVGTTHGGLPIYTYNYIGSPEQHMGVMAQEVEKVIPEAVGTHESGFLMVDYSKVR